MDDTDPTCLDDIIDGVEAVFITNKPLSITHLPNEILDKIMLHVSRRYEHRDGNDLMVGVSSTATEDIKKVRLSCRGLGAAASRYLIERVKVNVSLSSLSHLEEICEHPLVSKGVEVIEICLEQYDNFFDDGIQGFMQFIRHRLSYVRSDRAQATSSLDKIRAVAHCWRTYLLALETQSEDLLGTFDDEYNIYQDFKDVWDTGHNGPLLEGFYLYRSRLREQISLQQDGQDGFVARVSASMAKLPRAKHLEIVDWDTTAWGPQPAQPFTNPVFGLDLSSDDSLIQSLAESRNPFEHVQGTSLLSMIPNLICAGKDIKSLNIRISPIVSSYTELSLSNPQEAELRSGLKQLQSFKFENYRSSTRNPWNDALAARPLGQFLDACLTSENLEFLFINAKIRHPRPTRSLFSPRPWPQLKSAVLEFLPASAADLDLLTKSLAYQPAGSLVLRSVNLYCGGTWASVLDMLRNRRIRTSLGEYQGGAEFETDPGLCEEVFFANRVYSIGFSQSFAECYVEGEDMPNPMVSPPDEALYLRLFGTGTIEDAGQYIAY